MSKTSGYIGSPEPKRKIWLVLQGVLSTKLEDSLNEHAALGYQAYRIDRFERLGEWDHGVQSKDVYYDLVLFNPVLLGELNAAGMAEMLAKVSAGAGQVAGAPTK